MKARVVAVAVVTAAAAAPAAQAAGWTRVTKPDGSSTDQVGLARSADGGLHVAWHHPHGAEYRCRNRFRLPSLAARIGMVPMEPGSLVMERRMLYGIRDRAEDLARGRASGQTA